MFLLVVIATLHLVFALRTHLYFSQDDFAVLAHFKNHSTISTIVQFLTVGDIWGFHKILGFLNFKLLFYVFRVDPVPYIINNHLLHTANVLLVFLITKKLSRSNWKSFLAAVVFNKFYLFYFSNVHEYLVSFLVLLTVWLYHQKRRFLPICTFVLALLTKEIAVTAPFFLMGIDSKRIGPFMVISGLYLLYQAKFFISRFSLSSAHPYLASWPTLTNFIFYVGPVIPLLTLALLISQRYKNWQFALAGFAGLLPVLLLVQHKESHYLYLPVAYFVIYLGSTLPKLTFKSLVVYLLIIIVFGGRAILPKIAWIDFPNWQKVAIDQMLDRVKSSLASRPQKVLIDLTTFDHERDVHLLLGSQVIDLFLPPVIASNYRFSYNLDTHVLTGQKVVH